jgi:hypothetical protein
MTGIRGFGKLSDSGFSRVPYPAARIIAFIGMLSFYVLKQIQQNKGNGKS